jgi:hypothetical protein
LLSVHNHINMLRLGRNPMFGGGGVYLESNLRGVVNKTSNEKKKVTYKKCVFTYGTP